MSLRRIPMRLTAVALAVVVLLAWLPVPDAIRNVLLLGWVIGFYAALVEWTHTQEMRALRQKTVRPYPQKESLPDEFLDADRIAMQTDFHIWDSDVNAPCPQEAL